MNIKEIFQQGMNEFKRRSALRKTKRLLWQKEKLYSQQLTSLGKKAWESRIDITTYGTLKDIISTTQEQHEGLRTQLEQLEKQRQETEDKRKQENDTFESRRKEVEEKKKEVDSRLDKEKKVLKGAQKESDNAKNRLNHIPKEEEQLKQKAADADTSNIERAEIQKKLDAFVLEKEVLDKKIKDAEETIKNTNEKITPIEEESKKLQNQINDIRAEQKEVIGKLDQSLAETREKINDCNKKLGVLNKEQDAYFEQLGERLAAAGVGDEAVSAEFAEVRTTEKDMADIKVNIDQLDQEETPTSRRSFWTMISLVIASVVVIILVIILLSTLFGPGDKTNDTGINTTTPPAVSEAQKSLPSPVAETIEKYKQRIAETTKKEKDETGDKPMTMEEAMEKMKTVTGEIKKQSEQIQGKEIVAADKAALTAALPDVSGWTREEPQYQKGSFAQLETSTIRTTYTAPDSQKIKISITDTASASVALQTWRIIFQMNLAREDERGYQKITTVNNIPVIEKYDKQSDEVSLGFIVKDRYMVELESRGKDSVSLLKNLLPQLDLSKLE
jgi:DNA repair exonuclease SbcCD ATPase subunit